MSRVGIQAGKAVIRVYIDDYASNQLKKINSSFQKFNYSLKSIGDQAIRGGFIGAVTSGFVTNRFIKFEDAILELRAKLELLDLTSSRQNKTIKDLEDYIRNLGKTTSFTADQIAAAAISLAAAGFKSDEIKDGLVSILDLARAGNYDLGESADFVSNMIRTFNLTMEDSGAVVSKFVAAAQLGTVSIADLRESLKYASGSAANLKQDMDVILALLVQASESGLKGSLGGTSFNTLINQLAVKYKDLQGEIAGFNATFNKDGTLNLIATMKSLYKGLEGLNDLDRQATIADIFNLRGARFAEATKELDRVLFFVDKIKDSQGLARKSAELMDSGMGGSFRRAKGAANDFLLTMGQVNKEFQTAALNLIPAVMMKLSETAQRYATLTISIMNLPFALLAGGAALLGFVYVLDKVIKTSMLVQKSITSLGMQIRKGFSGIFSAGVGGVRSIQAAAKQRANNVKAMKTYNAKVLALQVAHQARMAKATTPSRRTRAQGVHTRAMAKLQATGLGKRVAKLSKASPLQQMINGTSNVVGSAVGAFKNTYSKAIGGIAKIKQAMDIKAATKNQTKLSNLLAKNAIESEGRAKARKIKSLGAAGLRAEAAAKANIQRRLVQVAGKYGTGAAGKAAARQVVLQEQAALQTKQKVIGKAMQDAEKHRAMKETQIRAKANARNATLAKRSSTAGKTITSVFGNMFKNIGKGSFTGISKLFSMFKIQNLVTITKSLATFTFTLGKLSVGVVRFIASLNPLGLAFNILLLFGHKIPIVVNSFKALGDGISAAFRKIMEIGSAASSSFQLINVGISELFKGDTDAGIQSMVLGFTNLATVVGGKLSSAWYTFKMKISEGLDVIYQTFQSLSTIFTAIIESISTIAAKMTSGLFAGGTKKPEVPAPENQMSTGEYIVQGVLTAIQGITSAFMSFQDFLWDWQDNFILAMSSLISKIPGMKNIHDGGAGLISKGLNLATLGVSGQIGALYGKGSGGTKQEIQARQAGRAKERNAQQAELAATFTGLKNNISKIFDESNSSLKYNTAQRNKAEARASGAQGSSTAALAAKAQARNNAWYEDQMAKKKAAAEAAAMEQYTQDKKKAEISNARYLEKFKQDRAKSAYMDTLKQLGLVENGDGFSRGTDKDSVANFIKSSAGMSRQDALARNIQYAEQAKAQLRGQGLTQITKQVGKIIASITGIGTSSIGQALRLSEEKDIAKEQLEVSKETLQAIKTNGAF